MTVDAPGTVVKPQPARFLTANGLPDKMQYYEDIPDVDVQSQYKKHNHIIHPANSSTKKQLDINFKLETHIINPDESFLYLVFKKKTGDALPESNTNGTQMIAGHMNTDTNIGEVVVLERDFPLGRLRTLKISLGMRSVLVTPNTTEAGLIQSVQFLVGNSYDLNPQDVHRREYLNAGLVHHPKPYVPLEATGTAVNAAKIKPLVDLDRDIFLSTVANVPFTGCKNFTENDLILLYKIPLVALHPCFAKAIPAGVTVRLSLNWDVDVNHYWRRLSNNKGTNDKSGNKLVPANHDMELIPTKCFLKACIYQFLASTANTLFDLKQAKGLPLLFQNYFLTSIGIDTASLTTIFFNLIPPDGIIPTKIYLFFIPYDYDSSTEVGKSRLKFPRNNLKKITFTRDTPAYNQETIEWEQKDKNGQKKEFSTALTSELQDAVYYHMNNRKLKRTDLNYLTEIHDTLPKEEYPCIWIIDTTTIMPTFSPDNPIGGNFIGSFNMKLEHGEGGSTKTGAYYVLCEYQTTGKWKGLNDFIDDRTEIETGSK